MKRPFYGKGAICGVLVSFLLIGVLTGCQYESLDDYLKALGIRDPIEYEDIFEETTIETSPEILLQATTDEEKDSPSEVASFDAEEVMAEPPVYTYEEQELNNKADMDFSSKYLANIDPGADKEVLQKRAAIGLTDQGIANKKERQKGKYAYEKLTDAGKTLYVEMLTIMENLEDDVAVSTTSSDAIELVFEYIMTDHPEIFYVSGYRYTNYSVDDVITRVSFSGDYTCDANEVAKRKMMINDKVNECLSHAPVSEDDYYAIKYVYEYIIENTDYDPGAPDNQNICSVFIGGRSVCNGYAKAAQYLLNKMDIECSFVSGTVTTKNGKVERHAWNLVQCNNAYYYVDVTWGDASYQTVSGESADATKVPTVNYDYLNVTTEELGRHHELSDIIRMPVCNSIADNYYVREGEYFTEAELSLVSDLFERRYRDGSMCVTIKCANDAVYDSLFEELITNRKVFGYLQGDTSKVSYTTFEDTGTIMFWLQANE